MFLSRLNEISRGCEKIVKVANAFLRAKLEENNELLRTDNGHRLTYEHIFAPLQVILFITPQIFLQRAVKYLTNSLPFTTWDVYFSMISGTILWINIFLLLEQSNVLSSWINFKRRLSSHWTSKFKKEGIKVSVLWYILGYFPVLTGNIFSLLMFLNQSGTSKNIWWIIS